MCFFFFLTTGFIRGYREGPVKMTSELTKSNEVRNVIRLTNSVVVDVRRV